MNDIFFLVVFYELFGLKMCYRKAWSIIWNWYCTVAS